MSSLEKRVISAILTKIRARQKETRVQGAVEEGMAPAKGHSAKLRQVQFSDYDAVTALKKRWGLTADSIENWDRLWKHNPALKNFPGDRPMGWVLESDAGLVGYLGNISSTYFYGDRILNAVTSSGLAVEPAYRSVSLSLVAAFYRQESVDLFLTTTAIPSVGRIARVFKSDPLPQPDYETVLFWVLQPYPFAQAVSRKLALRPGWMSLGSRLGSLAVRTDTLLRTRKPRKRGRPLNVTEFRIDQIGSEFETLWQKKIAEPPQLLADRSACTLKWHYQIPGDTGNTAVLCCHDQKELSGYAVIRSGMSRMNRLQRSLIADMLVPNDDPEVIRALLVTAHEHAKKSGSHVLEVMGFPHSVRNVCLEGKPYFRKYPACPFYFRAADPMLHKKFNEGAAWYATPFDGDTTLMP
jgi:hypothetical protein